MAIERPALSPVSVRECLADEPQPILSMPRLEDDDDAAPVKPGRGRGTDATDMTADMLSDLSSHSDSFEGAAPEGGGGGEGAAPEGAGASDPADNSQDAPATTAPATAVDGAEDEAGTRRDKSFSDFLELLSEGEDEDKSRDAPRPSSDEQRPSSDETAATPADAAAGTSVAAEAAEAPADPLAVAAACKETARFHGHLVRDSVYVQMTAGKTNDDEVHEAHPHPQDFLVPAHSAYFHPPAGKKSTRPPCARGRTARLVSCLNSAAEGAPLPEHEEAAEESKEEEPSADVPDPEEKLQEAADLAQPSSSKPAKRRVHFGTVLVRDYAMILGDHPCCSYGPPLTIGWDYLEYEPLPVNDYEFHQPPRRCLREMGLNYYQRKALLSNAGYTEEDFKVSKKQMNRIKMGRSASRYISTTYPLLKAETAVESACRKFKRLIKEDHWKQERPIYRKSVTL